MEGFSLPPLQLNTQEALTLLFALQAVTQLTDTPFNQERWTVIDKIRSILPKEQVEQLESLLSSFAMEVPKRNYKTPYLSSLITYTAQSVWLRVYYRSANHQRWLEIFPKRVYTAHGFWYCEAYSVIHGEDRVFRVDRFVDVNVLESPVQPLTNEHKDKETQTTNQSGIEGARIRIRARLTYKGMLQVEQDPDIGEKLHAISENEWEVDFQCPPSEWNWAVNFFFSLGLQAEVIEPLALRQEIRELSQKLYKHYVEE